MTRQLDQAFQAAGQQIGMNEREQNAALQEYMRNGGQNLDPAVTAWCAAYVNASLEQAGIEGTGRLNARSFMEWGEGTDSPSRGDIAVFSRGDPNGWQGHVGFFDGYGDDGRIRVLGGNQGDAVSLAYYDPARLLGFRTMGEGGTPVPRVNALGQTGPAPDVAQYPLGQPTGGGNALAQGMRPEEQQAAPEHPQNALRAYNLDAASFMSRPVQQNALAAPEFRPRYLTRGR